jgi:hypothetical protein
VNSNTEALSEGIKDYLQTNSELFKLEATQESSEVVSVMISWLIIGLFVGFFVFFLSMFVGFYLSNLLESQYGGFALVAGFYLLLSIVVFLGRAPMLERPLCNLMIKMVLRKTQ